MIEWLAPHVAGYFSLTQGPIADRTTENPGACDRGVVEFRRMLLRERHKIERGEDPIGILRDSARNKVVDLPWMTPSNVTNGLADSCATITARWPERFVAAEQGGVL